MSTSEIPQSPAVTTSPPRRTLSTSRVVVLVVAAAAPMAAMVGNVPLGLLRGNGVGLPAAFVVAAVVLLCFCTGYAAMSARVVSTGAFYVYIARALGKRIGGAAAYVGLIGYTSLTIGLAAAFGYFTQLVLASNGLDVPWWVLSAIGIAIVGFLGFRSADLSAKVLVLLMVAEFGILFIFQAAVVGDIGVDAFPLQSFSVSSMLSGSIGVALLFAFTSFVGFESAAIYAEETADPARSIPRAMYTSVTVISAFYVLTVWVIIGAAGGTAAPALAETELGNLIFTLAQRYGGEVMYSATAVLLCTSVLAALLALHNAASRYAFALGREGIGPKALGKFDAVRESPYAASLSITGVTVVLVGTFALVGADPYTTVASGLVGLGTLAVIAVQAMMALSVVVFFYNRHDRTLIRSVIAPTVGFIGLAVAFVLAVSQYSILTGSTSAVINGIPVLLVVGAVGGVIAVVRLRRRDPLAYSSFAATQLRK